MARKVDRASVGYHIADKNSDHCAQCKHYEGNGRCEVVRGIISPLGWCKRFLARKKETT